MLLLSGYGKAFLLEHVVTIIVKANSDNLLIEELLLEETIRPPVTFSLYTISI